VLRLWRVPAEGTVLQFRVEGQIIGEWVDLVAQECAAARREFPRIVLDLTDVTYADSRGLAMLRALDPASISIANATPLLLERLNEGGNRP
jgi:hypothetical protein